MIYSHYSDAPWDDARWPNFSAKEMSCPCCGEYYHHPAAFDAIQAVRVLINRPIRFNSTHRCAIHNARVGGAPLSQHKKWAGDIALAGQDRVALRDACMELGFTGFGYYGTFLHIDTGRPRWWASAAGGKLWKV